jgi:hypothetical protein
MKLAIFYLFCAVTGLSYGTEVELFKEEFTDSLLRPVWDVYSVDAKRIAALPVIDLNTNPFPLSHEAAIKKAITHIREVRGHKLSGYTVVELTLKNTNLGASGFRVGRFFYVLLLQGFLADRPGLSNTYRLVILQDGTIIRATNRHSTP